MNQLSALITALLFCTPLWSNTIVFPWRSSSAIRTPGDTLEVLYEGVEAEEILSLQLTSPYQSITLEVLDSQYGSFVYDELSHETVVTSTRTESTTSNQAGTANWKITTKIPDDTPRELFDLTLETSSGTTTSDRSVQVITEYKTQYTFVQITDTHVCREFHNGFGNELLYLEKIIEVVNIIGPEFVFLTGDLIMNYSNPDHNETYPPIEEVWSNFYYGAEGHKGVKDLDAPIFVSPGNHDYRIPQTEAVEQWHQHCGIRQQAFRYGDGAFILFDDYLGGYSGLDDWPTQQLAWGSSWMDALEDYSFLVISFHAPDSVPLAFCNTYQANLALCGHEHENVEKEVGTTPTLLVTTGSASHFGFLGVNNVGWFRIVTVDGDTVTAHDSIQYGTPSTGEMYLSLEFQNSNDGTVSENTATITNSYEFAINECRIRFVMEPGEYTIDNGTIEEVIHGEKVSVYDVRVDADAATQTREGRTYITVPSQTQVSISPQL